MSLGDKRRRLIIDPTLAEHGTASTYSNWQCRCSLCTDAHRADCGRNRRQRAERLAADPTVAPHGRNSTYTNWCCRCALCCAANTETRAQARAERDRRDSR